MTVSEVGRTDQRLLELLAAGVGDDRELGREALDVLGLALQVRHRDEQREVRVDVPGVLEPLVELAWSSSQIRVAVRPDDHRALGGPAVGQLGLEDDLVVPGGHVLAEGRDAEVALLAHGGSCRSAGVVGAPRLAPTRRLPPVRP
jgi:hypothetical protein